MNVNLDGYQTTSEIVDLTVKGGNMCNNWPDFPISVERATGGLIGNTVMVCGGLDGSYVDECYSLNGKVATLITQMSTERAYAASLIINGASLWITGGLSTDTGSILATSESITLEGSIPGPEMPIPINSHALVAINKTCSILIGGRTTGSVTLPTVYYFEHEGKYWSQGPDLMQARKNHAAGIVNDETTYDEFV